MIGPFHDWTRLGIVDRTRICVDEAPRQDMISRVARAELVGHGLIEMPDQLLGMHLILTIPSINEPSKLRRSKFYSLALPEDVFAMTRFHVGALANEHGSGMIWFLGYPVMFLDEDGMVDAAIIEDDPRPRVILRTYYGHESQLEPYP